MKPAEFFENYLRLPFSNAEPFKLLPWQREVLTEIFGAGESPILRSYYLSTAKKSSKTTLGAGLCLYFLIAEPNEPGARIYSAASDKEQAQLLWDAARQMIELSPELSALVEQEKLIVNRDNIVYRPKNGSGERIYQSIAMNEAGSHGLNASVLLIDELHAIRGTSGREFLQSLTKGSVARRAPLLFYMTTAGSDVTSYCFELEERIRKMEQGLIEKPKGFGFRIYRAEPKLPWDSEEAFAAANPSSFGSDALLHFFASLDAASDRHREYATALQAAGFDVKSVPMVRRGRNALSKGVDILLATRSAALLMECETLVLVSGDSDFAPLLEFARSMGRPTVLVALPLMTGAPLSKAADRFVSLEILLTGGASVSSKQVPAPHPPPDEIYIEKGQHFGPYLILRRLMRAAEREITIIDSYINGQIFEMIALAATSVVVRTITDKIQDPDYSTLISKLRREGRQLRVFRSALFHDRYLRIDETWWHSGHSLKDLGTKDSRVSKITSQKTTRTLARRESEAMSSATEICP